MHWHAETCEAFLVETHDNGADSKNCVRCFFLNPLEQQQKNRKICTSILFSLTCTTSARAIHTNPVISFSLACCLKVKAIAFLLHLRSVFFYLLFMCYRVFNTAISRKNIFENISNYFFLFLSLSSSSS